MLPSKLSIRRAMTFVNSLLLGGALLCLPGCFRVTSLMPDSIPAETHTQWVNGFLLGAVGGHVDAARYCGGRPVSRIETKRTAGNYLAEIFTLGIYAPSHVSITCGQPRWGQAGIPNGYSSGYGNPYPLAYPSYPPPYAY